VDAEREKTCSEETRAKLRAAQTKNMRSVEARARISAALTGKIVSEETRAKLSAANKSRHRTAITPEHRAKMVAALRKPETRAKMRLARLGKSMPEEARAKIRAFHTGKTHPPCTPETRAKQRLAHLGKHLTPEHRAKLREANLGKHLTPEHRNKISMARSRQVLPSKDTKPELAVQTWLHEREIEFTPHQHIPGLRHRWDVVITARSTLVEIDGCYWHACPICKLPRAHVSWADEAQTAFAQEHGWTIIRMRECEINKGDFSKLENIK